VIIRDYFTKPEVVCEQESLRNAPVNESGIAPYNKTRSSYS